jgi:hypothetical protein
MSHSIARHPLVSDSDMVSWSMSRENVREEYETKWGVLIQSLVDALSHSAQLSGKKVSISDALASANAHGFKPSDACPDFLRFTEEELSHMQDSMEIK